MFIPKRFKAKHRILSVLANHYMIVAEKAKDGDPSAGFHSTFIHTSELAIKTKLTEQYVRQCCTSLVQNKEVNFESFDTEESVSIGINGITSYDNKKYITEGRNLSVGRIKDYLSITIAFFAIGSAIYTACKAIVLEKRNKESIETLRQQVDELKELQKQKPPPQIYPSHP